MFGLLNVLKPAGCTSRDVVNRVQRLVKPVKVGHAGTLDPLATGVLILGLGPATRLVPFVQESPKSYAATFLLGHHSDTDDTEGEVVQCHPGAPPTRDQIEREIPQFLGEILQRPPDYSAVKVRGQRAYALARRGAVVELAARPATVHAIRVTAYDYPSLTLEIECGSGTYIRSIGRDLALALGTSAVMSGLVRTAIGGFRIEQATAVESLVAGSLEQYLLPPELALAHYPTIVVTPEECVRLSHGQFLSRPGHAIKSFAAATDSDHRLVAVVRAQDGNELRPDLVFCAE